MALIQVTVTVQEADLTPIPDVRYSILDTGQAILFASGVSSVLGVIGPVSLEESTDYAVLLSKPWTDFTVPQTISVPAGPGPASLTVTGAPQSVAPPADVDLCRLFGDVVSLDGSPMGTASIRIDNLYKRTGAGRVVAGAQIEVIADQNGHFEIDLARGAVVRLSIVDTSFAFQFVVPDQPTASLDDVWADAEMEIGEPVYG